MSNKNEKSFWREIVNLKKLWPYLRSQKKLLMFSVVLIPLISLLEMTVPIIIKTAIDDGISKGDWAVLARVSGYYITVVIIQYFARSTQAVTTALAIHRMIKKLRTKVIAHVLDLSCSFHDKALSGALVTRATSDFDNLSESLNTGVLTSVIDVAVLVGALAGLFYLDWRLAIASLAILPFVGIVVSWFSKKIKSTMLRARAKLSSLNAFTQECLYGGSTIKLLAAEDHTQKKYDALAKDYREAQMSSVVLDASMFSIIDGLTSITVGVVLFAALKFFAGVDNISAGLVVAFVQYVQQMFEPIKHLSNKIAMLQGAFTAIDRIFGVLDNKDLVSGKVILEKIKGSLKFDHVSFSYQSDDRQKLILDDVNFEISHAKSLALVGATGSGKSTIAKLITKLYDGYEGEIYLDGNKLSTLCGADLRKKIAIVPQDIVLFDGSVAFNIGLGLDFISQEDIEAASKTVGAHAFISQLPGGYNFAIREQGANLSMGQKQLIAFARALAKNPNMIILDEATSSVDPDSEEMIQAGLNKIMAGRSVIIIAHRLSTIQACDKIIVVDKGQIIEQGNHQELLSAKGAYFQLHSAFA